MFKNIEYRNYLLKNQTYYRYFKLINTPIIVDFSTFTKSINFNFEYNLYTLNKPISNSDFDSLIIRAKAAAPGIKSENSLTVNMINQKRDVIDLISLDAGSGEGKNKYNHTNIILETFANTLDELNKYADEINNSFASGFIFIPCLFNQKTTAKMIKEQQLNKQNQIILSSKTISKSFLPTNYTKTKTGFPLGIDLDNQGIFLYDLEDSRNQSKEVVDTTILGTKGYGKSVMTKRLIEAKLAQGNQVITFDFEDEYSCLNKSKNGTQYSIERNSGGVNPFYFDSSKIDLEIVTNPLADKIAFLESFLKYFIEPENLIQNNKNISNKITSSLEKFYNETESKNWDTNHYLEFIKEKYNKYVFVEDLMRLHIKGKWGGYFNATGTLDFSNKFINLNLNKISNETIKNATYYLLFEQILSKMLEANTKITLVLEEYHLLLKEKEIVNRYIKPMKSRSRKYGLDFIEITQDLAPYYSTSENQSLLRLTGRIIIFNCKLDQLQTNLGNKDLLIPDHVLKNLNTLQQGECFIYYQGDQKIEHAKIICSPKQLETYKKETKI